MLGRSPKQQPLIVKWRHKMRAIGDFTFCLPVGSLVKMHAGLTLKAKFPELQLGPIISLNKPQYAKVNDLGQRVAWRDGPFYAEDYCDIWVNNFLEFDKHKTTFSHHLDDKRPNQIEEFRKNEEINLFGIPGPAVRRVKGEFQVYWSRRRKNCGVFIDKGKFEGQHFFGIATPKDFPFRMYQLDNCMFCTDIGKKFIETEKFTNVIFLEYGEFF